VWAGRDASHNPGMAFRSLCEDLGRLPERLRGNGLETVHQKAVAVIVVVEDPPQVAVTKFPPITRQHKRFVGEFENLAAFRRSR